MLLKGAGRKCGRGGEGGGRKAAGEGEAVSGGGPEGLRDQRGAGLESGGRGTESREMMEVAVPLLFLLFPPPFPLFFFLPPPFSFLLPLFSFFTPFSFLTLFLSFPHFFLPLPFLSFLPPPFLFFLRNNNHEIMFSRGISCITRVFPTRVRYPRCVPNILGGSAGGAAVSKAACAGEEGVVGINRINKAGTRG